MEYSEEIRCPKCNSNQIIMNNDQPLVNEIIKIN